MYKLITPAAIVALLSGVAGSASPQAEKPLAVPGAGVAREIPNAKELPDPNTTYKVLFDVSKAAPKPDDINPSLALLARYVNTLDRWGVPADHRRIAVIFHQGGSLIILNNETYKSRTGHDNPNIALIQALNKAGVDFHVCGQSVLANKIDTKTILPEINVDLWAMVSVVNFQTRGYVFVGN